MWARTFIRAVNSRQFAIWLSGVTLCVAYFLTGSGEGTGHLASRGLVFSPATPWIDVRLLSWAVNAVALAGVAFIFLLLNNRFKLYRSNSWLFVWLFFIMLLPFGPIVGSFNAASILALTIGFATILLFTAYALRFSSVIVFNVFLLLSLATMWISSVAFFVPVMVVGIGQMRVLKIRQAIAAVLGLVTPYWIVWGFNWAPPFQLHLPEVDSTFTEILATYTLPQLVYTLTVLLMGIFFLVAAVVKSMNYNASRRAYNGFIEILLVWTLVLIPIDIENFSVYLTLLNIIVAFECAHFFTGMKPDNNYLPVIALPCVFIALTIWNYL